ncbi:hypothetical protein BJ741DRAFT_659489 [Chytriomyces cf. hyalinus JEL632]|nr:hypothetical protein BJ741DRAFT_659489 [Chytriomyces cf. hyalinus JEL632]
MDGSSVKKLPLLLYRSAFLCLGTILKLSSLGFYCDQTNQDFELLTLLLSIKSELHLLSDAPHQSNDQSSNLSAIESQHCGTSFIRSDASFVETQEPHPVSHLSNAASTIFKVGVEQSAMICRSAGLHAQCLTTSASKHKNARFPQRDRFSIEASYMNGESAVVTLWHELYSK